MRRITRQELQHVRSVINNELRFDNAFPQCIIIQNVALPEGWSKDTTDIMIIKENNEWTVFVDGDVSTHPHGNGVSLSGEVVQGWRRLLVPVTSESSLAQFIIDLGNYLPIGTRVAGQNQPASRTGSQPDTRQERPVIQNVNVHVTGNTLQLEYEYRGRPAIICQEIWDISNHKVKTLDVREVQEGVVRQEWNLADDNGQVVPDGFYLLKLRTSQPEGEIFKIETIHITTRSNNNG